MTMTNNNGPWAFGATPIDMYMEYEYYEKWECVRLRPHRPWPHITHLWASSVQIIAKPKSTQKRLSHMNIKELSRLGCFGITSHAHPPLPPGPMFGHTFLPIYYYFLNIWPLIVSRRISPPIFHHRPSSSAPSAIQHLIHLYSLIGGWDGCYFTGLDGFQWIAIRR